MARNLVPSERCTLIRDISALAVTQLPALHPTTPSLYAKSWGNGSYGKFTVTTDYEEQVSNSLVASQKDREFREQQELPTHAAQQTNQLSEVLYKNRGASYLQVPTSATNYCSADLNLVEAQLNDRLALVQLYQALGGGWQQ